MESCLTTIIKSLSSIFYRRAFESGEGWLVMCLRSFVHWLFSLHRSGEGGVNMCAPQILEFFPALFMAFTLKLCFSSENKVKLSP